jgi:adenosylcobinamide-GDP ribazoletransferase
VNVQWRLFLAALHFVTRSSSSTDSDTVPPHSATRFVPLIGILVGLLAAAVYWSAAQLWPTNVAVAIAMLATALVTGWAAAGNAQGNPGALCWIFIWLIKYNVLMALSAASVPVPLPAYLTLGLIMVAGQAASRALVVSIMATAALDVPRVNANDLIVALMLGFAPATLLGVPGLVGLVTAIAMRLALTAILLPKLRYAFRERLEIAQHASEICFYLGALATWQYS